MLWFQVFCIRTLKQSKQTSVVKCEAGAKTLTINHTYVYLHEVISKWQQELGARFLDDYDENKMTRYSVIN